MTFSFPMNYRFVYEQTTTGVTAIVQASLAYIYCTGLDYATGLLLTTALNPNAPYFRIVVMVDNAYVVSCPDSTPANCAQNLANTGDQTLSWSSPERQRISPTSCACWHANVFYHKISLS
eukprot:RCo021358